MEQSLLEQVRNEEAERGFLIRDDIDAERCLRRIKAIQKEYGEYLAAYEERIKKAKERCKQEIEVEEQRLKDYFQTVPHKKGKTSESYQLAGGKLVQKRQEPEYVIDQEKLVPYLQQNNPDYVRVKKEADWSALKKTVVVKGKEVFDGETGEIIPGIEAVAREDKFAIQMRKDDVDEH